MNHPYFDRRPIADVKERRPTSYKVPFIELIRPDGLEHPLTIEKAFETLRWMIATGKPLYASPTEHGKFGIPDLLRGRGREGAPQQTILSIEDLFLRFHRALLGRGGSSPGVQHWRKAHDIHLDGNVRISGLLTTDPEHRNRGFINQKTVVAAIERLLSGRNGERMAVAMDPARPFQNYVHRAEIVVSEAGYEFFLLQGDDPSNEGAPRRHRIGVLRDGETFVDALSRTVKVADCLIEGSANNCDLGDLLDQPGAEFVLDQVERIHLDADNQTTFAL